jgi:ATP-dependent RNA helicase DDX56/DBP9
LFPRRTEQKLATDAPIFLLHVLIVPTSSFSSRSAPTLPSCFRTARGHNAGVSLSLVSGPTDAAVLAETQHQLKADPADPDPLKPYDFKVEAIEKLRYRVRDALKGVSKLAIREARRKEIRIEIFNSEKLKSHFEANPRDAEVLRHDGTLLPSKKVKPYLKHLPGYLLPKGGEVATGKRKKTNQKFYQTKSTKAKQKKDNDPLKSFKHKKKPAATSA